MGLETDGKVARPGNRYRRTGRVYLLVALSVVVLAGIGSGSYALAHGLGPKAASWTNLHASGSLPSSWGETGVYLPDEGKTVMYYAWDSTAPCETWAYDPGRGRFVDLAPSGAKPRGLFGASAYDGSAGKILRTGVIHEDGTESAGLSETCAYDPRTNTWTDLQPVASLPPLGEASMAYDPSLGRVVLFGGHQNGRFENGTWAYDFATNRWLELKPANPPSARELACMVYDEASGRLLLFGGMRPSDDPANPVMVELDDTWAYDSRGNSWTELDPVGTPPGRWGAAIGYDRVSDTVIMFGGVKAQGGFYGDTWAYDPETNTWTELNAVGRPPARVGAFVFYDQDSGGMVLGGGCGDDQVLSDAWVFSWWLPD